VLWSTASVQAATPTCAEMPSCESLGYSQNVAADCQDSLSCPFDSTYKICLDQPEVCTVKECGIGDIYYSDGSCTAGTCYDASKAAVGVVFMLTDCNGNPLDDATTSKHGRVVNLHNLYAQSNYLFDASNPYSGRYAYLYWGLYGTTISNLTNYTSSSVTTSGSLGYALKNNVVDIYDGKSNTQKILAAVSSTSCSYTETSSYVLYCRAPAAEATHAFYPPNVNADDPKVGAGQWYLPAEGELAYLYGTDTSAITASYDLNGAAGTTKPIVNNTLSTLAGKMGSSYAATLTNHDYWSSTAYNTKYSWLLGMIYGHRGDIERSASYYVRAVLAF
jgi:hypothetical protein